MKKDRLLKIVGIGSIVLALVALPALTFAKSASAPSEAEALSAAPVRASVPNLVVTPMIVPLDGDSQVILAGSGFEPGQEISVFIRDPRYGALSDLRGLVDPEPLVNEQGSWASAWTFGRYISRGIFTEGLYQIWVADENGVALASAPLGLVDVTKPREEWPAWAQAAIPDTAE